MVTGNREKWLKLDLKSELWRIFLACYPPLDTLARCDTATLVDDLFIVFFLSDRDSIKR